MPLFAIPFPAIDPVAISLGPFAIRWYALAYIVGLLIGWRDLLATHWRAPPPASQPATSSRPPGRRRFPGVGDARGRSRRTTRLCPVLYAGLLRLTPARGTLCLARRHVVPRRCAWGDDCHPAVHPRTQDPAVCVLGHHYRGDPDRPLLRANRKFH